MKLTFDYIVKEERGKYIHDQRRFVNNVTVSYRGDDGHEYRKTFSSYGDPYIPKTGTHKELNNLKKQW